ncbi:MAG: lipoate--protein ligase family protein [Hyphomicrobiaceae bacterium]|nr:lipoate--protein ligase family protein [Hyphomicrobiaceae bacterium]
MPLPFRVIDTGVREGRANIAFDAALIDLHAAGHIPDTIRFLQFQPTALVGRHQAISRELKLDVCRREGFGIARRMTGGGAIYFDPGMLGWEVVLSRKRLALPSLADYTRRLCQAVAQGMSENFGINARFRPRNDIEVDGRKISGTGGFFDGDTLFFQGTVLIDTDPERVLSALNVPRAKLERHELDRPESRITTLRALIGHAPDVAEVKRAVADGLAGSLQLDLEVSGAWELEESTAAQMFDEEIGSDAFVYEIDAPAGPHHEGCHASPGGTVTAFIRMEGEGQAARIGEALITGDFFVTPPRLIYDLETALRGVGVGEVTAAVDAFFASAKADMLSIAPDDIKQAVEIALGGAK